MRMIDLSDDDDRRIHVFKFDRDSEIRNFFFSTSNFVQINVLSGWNPGGVEHFRVPHDIYKIYFLRKVQIISFARIVKGPMFFLLMGQCTKNFRFQFLLCMAIT